MADRSPEILVVDFLGGIGDLLMILPAIHGLARRNPGAAVRVLTHDPGADLLRGDPAVIEVRTPRHTRPGAERAAVAEALAAHRPDIAVSTTRYDGIHELLAACGARCVTDLWRHPPPDELVGTRYLRILCEEGLLLPNDVDPKPRVWLTAEERSAGRRALRAALPSGSRPPVVLVTGAGMPVKRWPRRYWRRLVPLLAAQDCAPVGVPPCEYARCLPAGDLRHLAACLTAVAELGGVAVGGDTGPMRLAAAVGVATVGLFGPTLADRYGFPTDTGTHLQGMPACPHRRPTAITEQVCWWDSACPLGRQPACMAEITPEVVADRVFRSLRTVNLRTTPARPRAERWTVSAAMASGLPAPPLARTYLIF